MKYAQGEVKDNGFKLTADNIETYLEYALGLDKEIRKAKSLIDLRHRLANMDPNDEIYTPEYIQSRLQRLGTPSAFVEEYIILDQQRRQLNQEIDKVKPLVFDEVAGKDPKNHEMMSELDDRRIVLDDKLDSLCSQYYPLLRQNLKKIYYMVVEGCDIDTLRSCFKQMKLVINGLSPEEAAATLMDESIKKYNLPPGIWDPIRNKRS